MDDKAMVTDIAGNGGQADDTLSRLSPNSPITEQPSFTIPVDRSRNHNGGSDRKRNRRAMADDGALDDILGQITSKLTTLSTKEKFTEEDSIGAFIDVLNCSRSEAQFYLESSAWNVETAVMLWLENNPINTHPSTMAVPTHAYYTGMGPYFDGQAMGGAAMGFQNFNRPKGVPMYRSREVIIEGLPAGWSARVSKHSGQIYFLEQASGKTQYCVPKGYADRDPEGVVDLSNSTHGTSSSANGNEEEMADDLDDSMDQDGPDSPVAGPPNSIDPRNSRPAARQHRSGVKSDGAYDDVVDSAFRSAMDEYANYSDASEVSSNKAVWDDGSGYSLNDNAFSVSDTTNSTNDSPVFSSMHGRGGGTTGSAASTFLSGANSMLTTASGASDGLNPSSSATHGNINIHNYSSNGEDGGPMTQDSTPTPLDSQLYPQSTTTTSHQGSSGPPSTGIAMMQGSTLGPGEGAEHSSDYFLGAFTPASSQHSSSNDLR